ncbi:MAG: hypothetical protein LBQ59_01985 [Candidatus Peribacteria bacterium]|jgi:hypothetical protein|nr:hypothetical protein [Candidatus Peribacteria bacterium]
MQQNDIIEQFYQKKEKEDKAKWDRWIKEETVPKELNHRFYKIKCFYVSRLQKTYNKYWTNDLDVDSLVSNFSDSDKTFISGSMKSLSVKKK